MNNTSSSSSLLQERNDDADIVIDDHHNRNCHHHHHHRRRRRGSNDDDSDEINLQLRLFAQCIQNWKRKNGGMINLYTFRAPLSPPPIQCRKQYASNHPQHQHKSNYDSDNDHLSSHFPHPQQQHDGDGDGDDGDDVADGDLNFPSFDEFILFSLQSVWIQAQHSSNLEGTHTLCVLIIESLQLISEFIEKVSKNNHK